MKTLTSLLLGFCLTAPAQNILINYAATNQPYAGLTNYPAGFAFTSSTGPVSGWSTNMTVSNYYVFMGVQFPAYLELAVNSGLTIRQALSNNPAPLFLDTRAWTSEATAATNFASWYQLYTMIPQGQSDCTTRTNAMLNDYYSVLSGTNTMNQWSNVVNQLFMQMYVNYIYHKEVNTYLGRLSPGILASNIYSGYLDPIGPSN